ncbi:MAG TPA: protease HtpX [Usitatibacter sp.]|nr:protease HtpX [Usitatibacter sp.]
MKRVVLFLLTNLAVMLVLSVTASLLGVNRYLAANGLNLGTLLAFSALMGFGGALISLLMSKPIAKWSTGAHVIANPQTADEQWLLATVKRHAEKAGIGMPEVAVFEGAPNAFATGAMRNSSLVAVSTGLLESMSREEVEAVIGHEVAHVANGDMVTLTLIQGVVNTFVIFLARVVGYLVDKMVFRTERGVGPGYMITVFVCEILFGIAASLIVAWFSRQREFRADAGSAALAGSPRPMIAALRRLGGLEPAHLPQSLQAFGIAEGHSKFLALFASHPPIPVRIAALESRRPG